MSLFRWSRGRCDHDPASGYAGGPPYGSLSYQGTDALGVVHLAVNVKCRHCGKPFAVAMFHTTDAAYSTHLEQIGAVRKVQQSARVRATQEA